MLQKKKSKLQEIRPRSSGQRRVPVWGSRACRGCRCACSPLRFWTRTYWGSEASAPRRDQSTDPTPPAGGTEWSPERCCRCEWTALPETPAAPAHRTKSWHFARWLNRERLRAVAGLLPEADWHYGRCAGGPSLWASPTNPRTLQAASGSMGCLQPPIWDYVLTRRKQNRHIAEQQQLL